MKPLLKLSLFALIICFGCSTENGDSLSSTNILIGTWEGVDEISQGIAHPYEEGEQILYISKDRYKLYIDDELWWNWDYEYFPERNEIVAGGYVFTVEIENSNRVYLWYDKGKDGTLFKRIE